MSIVAVYVDDIILACSSLSQINEIKCALQASYSMKDLGKLTYFLRVNVVQNENRIFINQSAYVNFLLEKFGLDKCNPVSTPADSSIVLEKENDSSELFNSEMCLSAVGSLLYLSNKTRQDVTFSVCNVAKFCC